MMNTESPCERLRIAVQGKGRLYDDSMELLKETGVKIAPAKRTLLVEATNFPVEVLFLRDDDIPQTVESGVADVGIVGENELVERGADTALIRRLGFSRCRLSLALPKEACYTGPQWFEGKTVATSYPQILRRWADSQGIRLQMHVIQGSVEVAPGIGLADAIFDIVSSGSTLVSNNLVEVETLMQSEALLIGHKGIATEKQAVLDELLFRIDAVLAAEAKVYVLMNVPNAQVDAIVSVLPGIKSPTVMPLATPGWSSVHTVIGEKQLWEIVGQLKQLGAEGILVLPIDKMIP